MITISWILVESTVFNCEIYPYLMKLMNKTFFFIFCKWDLICDRGFLGATIQSCFFAGMLIGSFATGMISDAWGRKKCIFVTNALFVSYVNVFNVYDNYYHSGRAIVFRISCFLAKTNSQDDK